MLTYDYDANGNRISETTPAGSRSYGYTAQSNRLIQAASDPVVLDANGNTLSDGLRSYTYNAHNQLIGVHDGAASYSYNGLGQRASKTTAEGTRRFVYDQAGHLMGEYNESGAAEQEIIWLGDMPLAVVRDGNVYYIHADHLNTPRVITDQTQRVVWRWDSDAFGTTAANDDPDGDGVAFEFNLRFPGQYYDAETGLHYNYFRYYDPSTGRYITSDPIGLDGGPNTYAYVNSNPLRYVDPLGLMGGGAGPLARPNLGPFGPVCGSGPGASWIPDGIYRKACANHDACYGDCKTPREICDLRLLIETGSPSYYWAVRLFGEEPFQNARKNCPCKP